jgi:hypothetical protein
MTDPSENQLIADVTRDIIAQTAPEELDLFNALSEEYFNHGITYIEPKDDKLGFGVGEAVTYLTPIALAVMTEVLKYLATQLARDAVERLIKRIRSSEAGGKPSPSPLSPEHIIRIRELVAEKARQLGISEPESAILARAVVNRLATPLL